MEVLINLNFIREKTNSVYNEKGQNCQFGHVQGVNGKQLTVIISKYSISDASPVHTWSHLPLVALCGGFFLACEDLGRMFDHSFPPQHFFFFLEVEISSRTLIPLFMPGSVHSGSASWDDCGRMFPDRLRVSSFQDRFPHYV